MKSFIVIGLGRFGMETAMSLSRQNCDVLAVDTSSDLVQQVGDYVTQAVVADARDKGVLRALDVKAFDCAVVAIGNNLADSVLATMNLKELDVPYIICKARDETHAQVLKKLGADRVVIPEKENAARLAKSLASTNVLDYIELSDDYGIIEISAPAPWQDKSLIELNVRAKVGVTVLAVKREKEITVSPGADFRIQKGDTLVVLGDSTALKAMQKL